MTFNRVALADEYMAQVKDATATHTKLAVDDFLDRFLQLKRIADDRDGTRIFADDSLDLVWRICLLHTKTYREYCEKHVGFFVEYDMDSAAAAKRQNHLDTFTLYEAYFGSPPTDLYHKPSGYAPSDWVSEILAKKKQKKRRRVAFDYSACKQDAVDPELDADFSELSVIFFEPQFTVTVRTMTDANVQLCVSENMSVRALKQLFCGKTGTPIAQQRVIFAGRVLHNRSLLRECRIIPDCTLHIVTRRK